MHQAKPYGENAGVLQKFSVCLGPIVPHCNQQTLGLYIAILIVVYNVFKIFLKSSFIIDNRIYITNATICETLNKNIFKIHPFLTNAIYDTL